jgi:hypothetical protein
MSAALRQMDVMSCPQFLGFAGLSPYVALPLEKRLWVRFVGKGGNSTYRRRPAAGDDLRHTQAAELRF